MSIFHLPGRHRSPEEPEAEPDPTELTDNSVVLAGDLSPQASTTTARAAGKSVLSKTTERDFVPGNQSDVRALTDRVISLRRQITQRQKPSKPPRD